MNGHTIQPACEIDEVIRVWIAPTGEVVLAQGGTPGQARVVMVIPNDMAAKVAFALLAEASK